MAKPTNQPILSIVIPVRNGLPYLREAIDSVLADLPDNTEIIVRDNWSTDGTLEWLRENYADRLTIVTAPEPVSAGANWSAVCQVATGRYIKLLCADDYLLEGGLRRQLEAAIAHPEAVLVASRRRIVDDSGKTVIRAHGLSGLAGERGGVAAITRAVQTGGNPFGEPSSVVFRADALLASLPFTEAYPYLTDLDMYAKVLQHGSFVGLRSVDAVFRLSTTSWSAAVGNSQLREYRGWVDHLVQSGALRLSAWQRGVVATRTLASFFARRVVTSLSSLASRARA